jgi:hypothetical protein
MLAPSRPPDEVEVLVEPHGQPRPKPQDQPSRDARLALGERSRARVVHLGERPPAPREVAVQVDTVRVAAGAGGDAVRVEVGDDPEVDPERSHVLQRAGDGDPARLVAVDAADDEHRDAVGAPDSYGLDWTSVPRPAEQERPGSDPAVRRAAGCERGHQRERGEPHGRLPISSERRHVDARSRSRPAPRRASSTA